MSVGLSVTVVVVFRHALPIDAVLSVVTGGSESTAFTVKPLAALVPVLPAASVCDAVTENAPPKSVVEVVQAPAVQGVGETGGGCSGDGDRDGAVARCCTARRGSPSPARPSPRSRAA